MATSKHNPLTLLMRQFKSLSAMETSLPPEQRSLHQWQLLATVGSRTYVIIKGGANTIGYRIVTGKNTPEWKYVHPTAMLEVLEGWVSNKYVGYVLVQAGKPVKKAADIRTLLEMKPARTSTIVGITPDDKRVKLYQWQTGVFNAEWKKLK